jgi:hypothetical protein
MAGFEVSPEGQPAYRSLDVRLSKACNLGRNRRLELAADLFNALDSENRFVNGNRTFTDNPNAGARDIPQYAQASSASTPCCAAPPLP